MLKRLSFLLMVLASLCALSAQNPDISATFMPASIIVNSFKTASFDPETPWTQPILTTLLINNTSSADFRFYMKVEIFWSGVEGSLVDATYISNEALAAGAAFYPLTNQDVITNQASVYFNRVGSINFSLDDIVNRSEVLKRAVMAGYFPDGTLTVRVSVQPESLGHSNWNSASVGNFSIHVSAPGVLQLVSPGVPIGGTPPKTGSNPPNFIWHSMDTWINNYYLQILEFAQNNPPDASSLLQSGRVFYEQTVHQNYFNDFLPYVPGNYYAWRVATPRLTELNPGIAGPWKEDSQNLISSDWFVFQYAMEDVQEDSSHRLNAYLNSLENKELRKLIDQGYLPAGNILWQGRTLSGQDAINLLDLLKDKELHIRIWE